MRTHALTLLLCISAATMAACSKGAASPQGGDLPQLPAERVMYGMVSYTTVRGVTTSRVHADTAYQFDRSDSTVLQMHGLNILLYDDSGKKSATLTSRMGTINTQTNAMVARGHVVLVTAEGKRVETEELHYDQRSGRVWSDVPSVIINPDGSRSNTKTFVTDDKFRNFHATGATGATGIKI